MQLLIIFSAKRQIMLQWFGVLALATTVFGVNDDLFNYGTKFIDENGQNSFPQTEWDAVSCTDVESCLGYANKYPFGFFSLEGNSNCRWCPDADVSVNCGLHRQSPIDLLRNRSVKDHPREKDCPDWHFFAFHRDSCRFNDIKGNFSIERHALQIHIPTLPNGDIDCVKDGKREYPRLDYSKGFPDWWHMARIDISVPSQHFQEGNQYAAEVTLAHFYEKDHFKNHLGHISVFLQDYEGAESWAYLDKMICQWRLEEDKVREACGLPPVAPYGRCSLLRGQDPTDEWLVEAGRKFAQDSFTASPLPANIVQEPAMGPTTPFPTDAVTTSNPTVSPTVEDSTLTPVATSKTFPPLAPSMGPTAPFPTDAVTTSIPTVSPTVEDSTLTPVATSKTFPPLAETTAPVASPVFNADSTPIIRLPSPVARPVRSPIVLQPIPSKAPSTALPSMDDSTLVPSTLSPSVGVTTVVPSTVLPTMADSTIEPTEAETEAEDTTAIEGDNFKIPASIQCRGTVNMQRLCEGTSPCCESVRSDTSFCWRSYEILGPALESACYHCCSTPKIVGPATPPKPGLPKTIKCSDLDNPNRMCKKNSCCSDPNMNSNFCRFQRRKLGLKMREACYYCCSKPQDYVVNSRERNLLPGESAEESLEGSRVVEAMGRKFLLRKENYEAKVEDETAHFEAIYEEFQRRSLQTVHAEDYENLDWYAYEWMLKAGTEYYFRYEGTMLVPPCWETVHWRVLKDPIRVHKRQIAELNRLLAWRLNPDTCEVDTAGVLSNNGNSVAVNRELQYNTDIHRKVFCECNDWTSKYEADNAWCAGADEEGNNERLYDRPYSFDTNGEWIP